MSMFLLPADLDPDDARARKETIVEIRVRPWSLVTERGTVSAVFACQPEITSPTPPGVSRVTPQSNHWPGFYSLTR